MVRTSDIYTAVSASLDTSADIDSFYLDKTVASCPDNLRNALTAWALKEMTKNLSTTDGYSSFGSEDDRR